MRTTRGAPRGPSSEPKKHESMRAAREPEAPEEAAGSCGHSRAIVRSCYEDEDGEDAARRSSRSSIQQLKFTSLAATLLAVAVVLTCAARADTSRSQATPNRRLVSGGSSPALPATGEPRLRRGRQLSHSDLQLAHSEALESEPEARHLQQAQQKGKRTLYACEGRPLHIECQHGEAIQLIRAIYGRFSIGVCNENATVDLKVNCMSRDSFDIISASCQAKQSCQLLASNSVFGDPCPETQKYLEVHYQCVSVTTTTSSTTPLSAANRTAPDAQGRLYPTPGTSQRPPNLQSGLKQQPFVIDPSTPAQDSALAATASDMGARFSGSGGPQQRPSPALPNWILAVPEVRLNYSATAAAAARASLPQCPETVWRQIHWPAAAAGSVVQMPCPSHAQSGAPAEPYAASWACGAGGQWAAHVQAARCQSLWLRNLTRRLEEGDSPLSALAELTARTRPAATPLPGSWAGVQPLSLFGDDLIQIGRLLRRLVEERMADLIQQIADDKQRVAFAREMVQSLVELVDNLAHEHQLEAWLDLAPLQTERQRLAGQLVQSLESAAVLLAGALNAGPGAPSRGQQEAFVRVTENAYVAIRSVELQPANESLALEVAFPSEMSTLATSWMDGEQRFTLHLQAGAGAQVAESPTGAQVDVKYPPADNSAGSEQGHTLRVVFVMIRALGAQMEPQADAANRVIVNSNLVSLSIVADSRYKYAPVKVDLAAPVELLFRHLSELKPRVGDRAESPRCVYWDATISDWLADGCKLVQTNRTHSTCACTHLTTFALLTDWDEQSSSGGQNQNLNLNQKQQPAPHQQQRPKVQLDSVENELILPNKMLYLAKMLDGHLFDSATPAVSTAGDKQQQSNGSGAGNLRLLIYICSLLSAALLLLYLSAAAYCRAHARRLLGAIPRQPPPPLLISNAGTAVRSASNSDSSPTYSSSDYSAALAANKSKLQRAAGAPATAHLAVPLPGAGSDEGGAVRVPLHLMAQLLALQVLLVLLIESHNYLQRRPFAALYPAFYPALQEPAAPLDPIGPVSWLLVLSLYYLVTAVTCWLASQLLGVNLELLAGASDAAALGGCSSSGSSGDSCADSDKSAHYGATNSTALSASARAVPNNGYAVQRANLYGPQTGVHSSTSPTSSFSSAGQSLSEQQTALSRLEDSSRLYGPSSGVRAPNRKPSGKLLSGLAARSHHLQLAVTHLLPPLVVGLVGWCSWGRGQSLNSVAYTSSFGSQLAYWPLLVDASAPAFSVALYYLPAVCLLLAGCGLFLAQRQQRRSGDDRARTPGAKPPSVVNPYGSSALVAASQFSGSQRHLASQDNFRPLEAQPGPMLNKQLGSHYAHQCNWIAQCRRAKFLCSMLLAFLALHALCWISFFAHLHLALNAPTSGLAAGNLLVCVFALSDLLLVLLVSWWQRRTLRRAAHLAGLSRLLACLRASSGRSTARHRARFYRQQQSGKPAGLKVSPSSQSLFLVSQGNPNQQLGYGQLYGAGYGQHLYQTLGQPQHIYDSAAPEQTPEQRANAMQLMQQERQIQQHNFTLSLLQQRRLQQQQLMHQCPPEAHLRQPATLKPAALLELERQAADGQLLSLEASGLKQQFLCASADLQANNERLSSSGEVDGPLVALSSSNSSTNGSNNNSCCPTASSLGSRLPATFGPNKHCPTGSAQRLPTEPQLFSQSQQDPRLQSSRPINCISQPHFPQRHAAGCPTSGADANHQYYSIGSQRPAANYTDALKAAMQLQHHTEAVAHHFRPRNPKRAMIDRELAGNIYDVANYALGQ